MIPKELKLALEREAENVETDGGVRRASSAVITPATMNPNIAGTPSIVAYGPLLVAEFVVSTEIGYATFKIPDNFVDEPAFHIHWTKNVNTDESGAVVRWQLKYKVFDGETEDVNVAAATMDIDATYVDNGTTTRIVYKTADGIPVGFAPGKYVGVSLQPVTVEGGISGEPALVSLDFTYNETYN